MSHIQFWTLVLLLIASAFYIGGCIERAAARLKEAIEWASSTHMRALDDIAGSVGMLAKKK